LPLEGHVLKRRRAFSASVTGVMSNKEEK
jgi:hypothetical protein